MVIKKWQVVGRTAPVVERRPTMPYPVYATSTIIINVVHSKKSIDNIWKQEFEIVD